MSPVKTFTFVWAACMISVVSIFCLFKLGSYMFHVEPTNTAPAPSVTMYNVEQCYKVGGTPVMDTNGDYDDFKECKLKETK